MSEGSSVSTGQQRRTADGRNLAALRTIRVDRKAAFGAGSDVLKRCDGGGLAQLVFPIVSKSEIIGLVEINPLSPITAERERLIRGIIKVYRIHLGILEDTDTDELTGVSNRKPFDEAFRRLTGLSVASGIPSF